MVFALSAMPLGLMGPGPLNVYLNILSALSKKTLGHLDPKFLKMTKHTLCNSNSVIDDFVCMRH